MEWRRWLLIENGWTGWLRAGLTLGLLAVIWLVLAFSLPVLVAVALSIASLVAVLPFFTPGYYRVDTEGITVRRGFGLFARMYQWRLFAGCRVASEGYWMVLSRPSGPLAMRALFLPLPLDSAAKDRLAGFLNSRFPTF